MGMLENQERRRALEREHEKKESPAGKWDVIINGRHQVSLPGDLPIVDAMRAFFGDNTEGIHFPAFESCGPNGTWEYPLWCIKPEGRSMVYFLHVG